MGYDKDWYNAYEAYLVEPGVRKAHDWAFSLIKGDEDFQYVVDLGCGQSQEYLRYVKPHSYLGIDQNAEKSDYINDLNSRVIKGNYRDAEVLKKNIHMERAFVSLFSSEVHGSCVDNYNLYNALFWAFPRLQKAIVSGLYHGPKKNENPMIANGNVIYQTREDIDDCHRVGYTEKRIILHVPSKMFGEHEVEVWKIFERT